MLGILVAAAFQSLYLTYDISQKMPRFREYAAGWDAMEKDIYQAKSERKTYVIVPPLNNGYDLEDIATDPQHWVNQCVSKYYDIKVVAAYNKKACK